MLTTCKRCSLADLTHLCRTFATTSVNAAGSSSSFANRNGGGGGGVPPARDWGSLKPAAAPEPLERNEGRREAFGKKRAGGGQRSNLLDSVRGAIKSGGLASSRPPPVNKGKWGLAQTPRDQPPRPPQSPRDSQHRSSTPPPRYEASQKEVEPPSRRFGPSEPLNVEAEDTNERGGRRGRADKFAKPSRSLIHGDGSTAELPGQKHRRPAKEAPVAKAKNVKAKKAKRQEDQEDKGPKEIYIPGTVTVGQLAKICGKKLCECHGCELGMSLIASQCAAHRVKARNGRGPAEI